MVCENAKKAALVNPKIILRHRLSGLEPDAIDVLVLMNGRKAVAPLRGDDQHIAEGLLVAVRSLITRKDRNPMCVES